MSNYLSKPIETAPIVSNYNFELINQVLATKQGQYNYNREKLQNAIGYVENLKVSRPQDQEYLNAKISEMYSTLNMGDKNLSDGVVADSYYSAIMSVAQDPTIINAVGSTQVINNFYANIQKMQSDPKTAGWVNDRNIAYSLEKGGWNDYMAGKTDSVKSLSYTNYVDVQKELFETLKTVKDLRGDEEVQVRGTGTNGIPVGEMRVRKVSGMTPQEMIQYIPGLLTPQQEQQMIIDGWAIAKNNPEQISASFRQKQDSEILEYENAIGVLKASLNNTTIENKEKTEIQNRIKVLERELDNKRSENDLGLEQQGFILVRDRFINTIANTAGARVSEKIEKDDIYFARENLNIRLEELALAKEKAEREKKAAEPTGDATLTTSTFQSELAKDLDIVGIIENEYKTNNDNLIKLIGEVSNQQGIDKTVADSYEAIMRSMGYDKNGTIINRDLAGENPKELAMYKAYRDSGMSKLSKERGAEIEMAKTNADNSALDNERFVVESIYETYKENPNKYVNSFNKALNVFGGDEIQKREVANQIVSLLNDINGTNLSVTDILTERNPIRASAVMGAPVEVLGGSSFNTTSTLSQKTITESLSKANGKQLKRFADILDIVLDNRSVTQSALDYGMLDRLFDSSSLKSGAKGKVRDKAIAQGSKAASFGTVNLINISGKNTVKSILDAVPNQAGTQQFDYSKNITARKGADGSIIITQGTPVSSTGKQAPAAEHTFGIYDDGYAMVSSLIDDNVRSRGLDANRTNNAVGHTSKPKFIDGKNRDLIEETTTYFGMNMPTISKLGLRPEQFLTESNTKKVFKEGVSRVVAEQDIDQTVDYLTSKIGTMKAKFVPVNGQWSLEITAQNGKILHKGKVTSNGYLDKNLVTLINNYPEVLIADKLLEEFMSDAQGTYEVFN